MTSDSAPETYEAMTAEQQSDWYRARHQLASERPLTRKELKSLFATMTTEQKQEELKKAVDALELLDLSGLIGDSSEEDPFDRDYRIKMEETVRLLSHECEIS